MKLKDVDLKKRFMIALIGQTGAGKSAAAGSFHKVGPIKFFDFDGRMKGVKKVHPDADIDFDSYGPKELNSIFRPAFNSLVHSCPWKTIVVDSLTSLSVTTITAQMLARGDSGKTTKGGIYVTGWDEINGETVFISQILDVAKVLPCNVIMTFHPITRTVGTEGNAQKIETVAAYGNKINQIALNYFDEVYYIDTEKGFTDKDPMKRVAYTDANTKAIAKSALPLPPKMDISGGLYDAIMSYLK
jgi:ABC-type dipeptide/oligopeptide/nickel transport system ATPase component